MPLFFLIFALALAAPVIWPQLDLFASGLFYRPGSGFFLATHPLFVSLHWFAYYGARALGVGFAVMLIISMVGGQKRSGEHRGHNALERIVSPSRSISFGCSSKLWLFLLLALLIGPALIANAGFKDHWGRARPREIIQFGGTASFSPPIIPQAAKRHNGSFVSGDGAFGFFLPVFAYVVPRRLARRTFWGTMALGGLFGLARLVMGAHFLSDILYAAALMLLTSAATHAAFYGRAATAQRWRDWFEIRANAAKGGFLPPRGARR